jgi:hypothetical protein
MGKWLFLLLGLLVGLLLAILLDRMRFSRGSGPVQTEKSRWIHFWYMGRFPTPEEEAQDDQERREREEREKLRRIGEQKKGDDG